MVKGMYTKKSLFLSKVQKWYLLIGGLDLEAEFPLPPDLQSYSAKNSDFLSICFAVSLFTETQSFLAIITEPASQTVQAGSSATLKCSAQSNKKITYEWVHNNNTIQVDKEPRITIRDDGSLRISKTELDDEGLYRCLASIKRGTRKGRLVRKSRPALLTVEGKYFS